MPNAVCYVYQTGWTCEPLTARGGRLNRRPHSPTITRDRRPATPFYLLSYIILHMLPCDCLMKDAVHQVRSNSRSSPENDCSAKLVRNLVDKLVVFGVFFVRWVIWVVLHCIYEYLLVIMLALAGTSLTLFACASLRIFLSSSVSSTCFCSIVSMLRRSRINDGSTVALQACWCWTGI